MSIESVGQSGGVPAVIQRDPLLDKALVVARKINARPAPVGDHMARDFVREFLGKDADAIKTKKRELFKLLAPQNVERIGANPAEVLECSDALGRVRGCDQVVRLGGKVAVPDPGLASVIIVAAANVADKGLRMADDGLKAAAAAWQRKVDDGTVDAVKAEVRARAGDLFDLGRSVGSGWVEAIRRKRGNKS